MKKYEFLEHTSEIKFRSYGKTINEAFENIVLAFSEYISNGEKIKIKKGKKINVKGEDIESLVYNFINELIYLLDAESFVAVKAEVFVMGNNLKATLYGDDGGLYKGLNYIKSPTYNDMSIKKKDNVWQIDVVLDV